MKTLMILAGAAGFFYTANAAWKTTKIVDEMTDVVSYCITTEGSTIEINTLLSYNPLLCIRVTPMYYDSSSDSMLYKHDQYFNMSTDGLDPAGGEFAFRFDSSVAEVFTYSPSTDGRAGFVGDKAFKRIMNASNVTLRVVTFFGSIRTTRFSTVGLRDEIEKLKVQLKGTLPPPPAPDPKPTVERPKTTAKAAPEKQKLKCSKCSGKGTVKGWTKCVDCDGRGRDYSGKRCQKCVRSTKTGHVKADVPCSTCSGSGYLSK